MKSITFVLFILLSVCYAQPKIALFPLKDIGGEHYSQVTSEAVTGRIQHALQNSGRFTFLEREKLPELLKENINMNAQLDAQILSQIEADYVCFGTFNCSVDIHRTYLPDLYQYKFVVKPRLVIQLRVDAVRTATIIHSEQAEASDAFEGRSRSTTIKLSDKIFDRIYSRAISQIVNALVNKVPAVPPQPVPTPVLPPVPTPQVEQGNQGTTTAPATPANNTVVVDSLGIASNYQTAKDLALKDAFRMAIERVAGVYLKSESEMKDFQLVKDQVIAESKGIVQTYKILDEKRQKTDAEEVTLKVECTVSWAALKERWQTIRLTLTQKQLKKLVILTRMNIKGGLDPKEFSKDRIQQAMEGIFAQAGFEIVTFDVMEANFEMDDKARLSESDTKKMLHLGKKYRADLILMFNLQPFAEVQVMNTGVKKHTLITAVQGTMTRLDSSMRQIGALPKTYTYHSLSGQYALLEGLIQAGEMYAKEMIDAILKQTWDVEAQEGSPVLIKILNISYNQVRQLKRILPEMSGIKNLNFHNYDGENRSFDFDLMTNMTGEKLTDLILDECEKSGIQFDVKGLTTREITLQVMGN